ncbi:hypothetical protein ACGF13_15405 [Kitasatospora sp. NPDC048286]|uniref:hypothetical protein n=1 Tax=unclassified Kitasatospora TaxID=2633591 RepID=UPI003710D49D
MSVRRLIASAATAALALVPVALAAPAAHAQGTPAYTCDVVQEPIAGLGHCVASDGAPAQGPFSNALISSRLGPIPMSFFCAEGFAETPESVICGVPG